MTSPVSRMSAADVVVVGGGIAGLAVAYHLGRTPGLSVLLLEREPVLASHSSGRNAAIFRPLEARPEVAALAARSVQLLDALMDSSRGGWLEQTGVLLVASHATALSELAALATEHGFRHGMMQGRDLEQLVPVLAGGDATRGLLLPDAGVVDIHAVITTLATRARAAGVTIATGCEVVCVRVSGGRVEGVELTSGEVIAAPAVVIAAGAWAASLGASCMAEVPLMPLRRHLVRLDIDANLPPSTPVVWRLDDEVYFREESGGVLASPCDEDPWPAGVPPCDRKSLESLATKLGCLAPGLRSASIRQAWACLRTFAPGRMPVAGADPWVSGLFWLAGLGGSGMTVGVAAGEVVAACVRGEKHSLASALAPVRV